MAPEIDALLTSTNTSQAEVHKTRCITDMGIRYMATDVDRSLTSMHTFLTQLDA